MFETTNQHLCICTKGNIHIYLATFTLICEKELYLVLSENGVPRNYNGLSFYTEYIPILCPSAPTASSSLSSALHPGCGNNYTIGEVAKKL